MPDEVARELTPQEEIRLLRNELTNQINSLASLVREKDEYIQALHDDIHEAIRLTHALTARLDQLVASHNAVGENVQWLVANTQGIFQMFSDPNIINQMMSGVLGGGMFGGGQSEPES